MSPYFVLFALLVLANGRQLPTANMGGEFMVHVMHSDKKFMRSNLAVGEDDDLFGFECNTPENRFIGYILEGDWKSHHISALNDAICAWETALNGTRILGHKGIKINVSMKQLDGPLGVL